MGSTSASGPDLIEALGGGEVHPIMIYTGRLSPKGVSFSGFRSVWKGKGVSLVEVYKTVGKSVIWVCEGAQKGSQLNLILWLYWLIPI